MTTESKNVATLKAAYKLWNEDKEGAYEHWLALMSDDVNFRSLGAGAPGMAFTRDCTSKDEVRGFFEGLAADWEMLHYTPEEFVADGDRVVVRGSCGWRNRNTGKAVETPKADFFRFRDGKIVEFFEFFDSAAARAATE